MKTLSKEKITKLFSNPLLFLLMVAISPLIFLIGLHHFLYKAWLNGRFRHKWQPQGKHILFVYSESPNWEAYIQESIAPVIEEKTVFLNWSQRSEWKTNKPLEAKILSRWGGGSEFNPMAILFLPHGKVKMIRFYQAFKEFKHGKPALLKQQESELFEYL